MRLEEARLARPYAQALFQVSKTAKGLESWSKQLELLVEIIECPEVKAFLKSPVTPPSEKKAVLKAAWSNFSKDLHLEQAERFIDLLVENRRLFMLPELIEALNVLRDQHQGRHKAIVEGAYPLKPEDESIVQAWLEEKIGKKVYIDYRLNPDLMSGFKAQVGDESVYASTEHLLQRLHDILKRDE